MGVLAAVVVVEKVVEVVGGDGGSGGLGGWGAWHASKLVTNAQRCELHSWIVWRVHVAAVAVILVFQERRWESYWTVNAIWEVLYLGVLVAICFLLRPSINNQRY